MSWIIPHTLFHIQIGVPRDANGNPVEDLYVHKELIES